MTMLRTAATVTTMRQSRSSRSEVRPQESGGEAQHREAGAIRTGSSVFSKRRFISRKTIVAFQASWDDRHHEEPHPRFGSRRRRG
jgi:hypothetical protein